MVGIPSIQNIEVLAGEILDRMAAVEKQLKSGEVVVGSEVMGRLGNQAIVKEWRQDESGEHFAVLTGLTEYFKCFEFRSCRKCEKADVWLLATLCHSTQDFLFIIGQT